METLLLLLLAADAPAGADPQTLIRRAIQAHGGPEKLDKLRLVREQTSGTLTLLGQKVTFTSETTQRLPGQFRHTLTSEVGGKKLHAVQIFDGKQGWLIEGTGLPKTADEKTLAGWKATAHAAHAASLTSLLAADKGYKCSALGEEKVQGKAAFGVRVSAPDQRDVDLWFERESGLLVKRVLRPNAGGPDSVQEEIYSDFKDIQGLKRPARVSILLNGVPHVEAVIRSTEFLERIDDKEFAKP